MSHKEITFPNQRPNEHVVLMLRRHWLILARDIAQLILSFIFPPIVFVAVLNFTDFSLEVGSLMYIGVIMLTSLYYLFTSLAFFHDFVDYHLDIWIVTDQRIISIEQEGLFHRVISELAMDNVQDVTSEVRGHIQTFFDFGQVYVQTAGEKQRFSFEQVPHPSEIAKIVLQVHNQTERSEELRKIRDTEMYRHQLDREQGQQNAHK